MPQSTQIDPANFSVRTMIPRYAVGNSEYTPWFIGHEDELMLLDAHLTAQFDAFKLSGALDPCDDSPAGAFAEWLENHGYVVFWSPEDPQPFIIPITDEDYIESLKG